MTQELEENQPNMGVVSCGHQKTCNRRKLNSSSLQMLIKHVDISVAVWNEQHEHFDVSECSFAKQSLISGSLNEPKTHSVTEPQAFSCCVKKPTVKSETPQETGIIGLQSNSAVSVKENREQCCKINSWHLMNYSLLLHLKLPPNNLLWLFSVLIINNLIFILQHLHRLSQVQLCVIKGAMSNSFS